MDVLANLSCICSRSCICVLTKHHTSALPYSTTRLGKTKQKPHRPGARRGTPWLVSFHEATRQSPIPMARWATSISSGGECGGVAHIQLYLQRYVRKRETKPTSNIIVESSMYAHVLPSKKQKHVSVCVCLLTLPLSSSSFFFLQIHIHTCAAYTHSQASFFNERYLDMYTRRMHDLGIDAYIDENKNCEDIAMQFLISNVTNTGPIFTSGSYSDSGAIGGISTQHGLAHVGTHYRARSDCLTEFTRRFGRFPLVKSHQFVSQMRRWTPLKLPGSWLEYFSNPL